MTYKVLDHDTNRIIEGSPRTILEDCQNQNGDKSVMAMTVEEYAIKLIQSARFRGSHSLIEQLTFFHPDDPLTQALFLLTTQYGALSLLGSTP